jgi:hypothetical protein
MIDADVTDLIARVPLPAEADMLEVVLRELSPPAPAVCVPIDRLPAPRADRRLGDRRRRRRRRLRLPARGRRSPA